ncbi:MAG: glutaredoxin domain-containing protein [Candidatus Pacebacteria bacterium]|nr:glutaredoxin domain-containing protein [Candidatus Paceibacterota bacterium]MDD5621200.1 glutaredoxin domain-containing protein [Candidatus Paceibacterota bacterium]
MAKIKVYSTQMCPYCVMAKTYLKDRGFEFEDLDVSSDQKALQELQEKTNALSVPVLDIDGTIVVGFDRGRINELLEIKE